MLKKHNKVTIITGPMGGHGGEESLLKLFCNNLVDSFDLTLFVSLVQGSTNWLKQIDEKVNVKKYFFANKLVRFMVYVQYLVFTKSDVIVIFTPKQISVAYKIKQIFQKKYKVVSWIQFSIFDYFTSQKQLELTRAEYHLAISTGIKQQLTDLGVKQENIFVVNNPVVPINSYIPDTNSKLAKFIYIGRIEFEGQKNLKELLTACHFLGGDWQLDIYGADDTRDGSNIRKSQEYCDSLGITDHINWKGWADKPWEQISEASCLVLSSKSEGFGMVLCEAISRGIPVISSDCPVGPSDIISKYNGFLYKTGDARELSKIMQSFISGQVQFEPKQVKLSIEKMYVDNYVKHVKKVINIIIDK